MAGSGVIHIPGEIEFALRDLSADVKNTVAVSCKGIVLESEDFAAADADSSINHSQHIRYRVKPQTPAPHQFTATEGAMIRDFAVDTHGQMIRYVKVYAKNRGRCPPWHKGAGGKAWIFADEIEIR